jgi:hypothetical protein
MQDIENSNPVFVGYKALQESQSNEPMRKFSDFL